MPQKHHRGPLERRPGVETTALRDPQQLISLAQKIARDAEHHALLSASLASQADRLLNAGLRLLEPSDTPSQSRTRLRR